MGNDSNRSSPLPTFGEDVTGDIFGNANEMSTEDQFEELSQTGELDNFLDTLNNEVYDIAEKLYEGTEEEFDPDGMWASMLDGRIEDWMRDLEDGEYGDNLREYLNEVDVKELAQELHDSAGPSRKETLPVFGEGYQNRFTSE